VCFNLVRQERVPSVFPLRLDAFVVLLLAGGCEKSGDLATACGARMGRGKPSRHKIPIALRATTCRWCPTLKFFALDGEQAVFKFFFASG